MGLPTILIVDDDPSLLGVLTTRLSKRGFTVLEASSGEEAIELLKEKSVDLVISDLRMGNLSGIDLLKWSKDNCPKPFLLMSGYSDISSTEEALKLGAAGFLPKPFRFNDMIITIKDVLGNVVGDELVRKPEDFKPVPISTFLSDCEVPFHTYLKINDSKFIKIAYSGEDLSKERLETLKKKGVKELYLLKEDHSKFFNFSFDVSSGVISDSKIPFDKKKDFIKAMSKTMLDRVSFESTNEVEVEAAAEFLQSASAALVEKDDLFTTLSNLFEKNKYLYAHSLSVSMLSILIAKKLGWVMPENLFNVAVGGFFHDIGKATWPEELVKGEVKNLNPEQKELVANHMAASVKHLEDMECFSSRVIDIVKDHHERIDGSGFPDQKKGDEISEAAQIVGLADWCVNTQYNTEQLNKDPKLEIRKAFEFQKSYEPRIFEAMMDVFGFQPMIKKKHVA